MKYKLYGEQDGKMKRYYLGFSIFFLLMIYIGCAPTIPGKLPTYDYGGMDKFTRNVHKKVEKFLGQCWYRQCPVELPGSVRIDSLYANEDEKKIIVFFNKPSSYPAYRPDNVKALYQLFRSVLGRRFRDYDLAIKSLDHPLEALIPNFYRSHPQEYDYSRMPFPGQEKVRFIENRSRPFSIQRGLQDRYIALWHSHGWYYDHQQNRWQWQRPRLFQTVEDLLPMSFTLPYLIPMLENAGARVFVPRERDIQSRQCVVDNDGSLQPERSFYRETSLDSIHSWITGRDSGFAVGSPPYHANENPFTQGTFVTAFSDSSVSAKVEWIPFIPSAGYYAVYISYHASDFNVPDASYVVNHFGGKTEFFIDQRLGGSTWLYLGTFKFKQGAHSDSGSVVLTNKSRHPDLLVSADAVRFGGGMGNVLRGGRTSNRPRFMEAARYHLQYSGMPDTLVYNLNDDENDYRDDYQSRGEYVNYLVGAPGGPNKNRMVKGLGIPIDVSLAFHTDAGFTLGDTTIGTLSIYSLYGADTTQVFPNGISRLANRDLADILQTTIVGDIRKKWNKNWTRRSLLQGLYSEAYRPNVPSVLIELLSHQNFADMVYALDPRFRFDVARAMYKGLARFIAFQHRQPLTIAPLPVTHLRASFSDDDSVLVEWKPNVDPLEPGAVPGGYILYTRTNESGFDNGRYVSRPFVKVRIKSNIIYSYKVCAVNAGGKSFPSEIISLGVHEKGEQDPVLIVNGFDRICGAATIDKAPFKGFFNIHDEGVADGYDFLFTGNQVNFDPKSLFLSNDAPGFGESLSDYETLVVAGNSFDFSQVHGKALFACGYSFLSCSDEAVMDSLVMLPDYDRVDFIFGEEKKTFGPGERADSADYTVFPAALQKQVRQYCLQGGRLFISGAYVATDLISGKTEDDSDVCFAREILKIDWDSNYGAGSGNVFSIDGAFDVAGTIRFNTAHDRDRYKVEAPDAITACDDARVILRYSENERGAGVAFSGPYQLVVLGFPFESIISEQDRHLLMQRIMAFLSQ
jgi:hypothetical protein